MNIGNLKANDKGIITGVIATLAVAMTIALRPVDSDNDRAPRFEVFGRTSAQAQWTQIGALWAQSSNSTGEEFLQGQIDDPSMTKPLAILLFAQRDGSYNVAWTRPRDRSAFGKNGAPQTAGDGLGESTSTNELPFDVDAGSKGSKAKGKAFNDANGDVQGEVNA